MNFLEELKWRGMLQDMTPGLEEALQTGMVTGYIGFDPTAPSLTIGNYESSWTAVGIGVEVDGDWITGGYMTFTNEGITATVTFDLLLNDLPAILAMTAGLVAVKAMVLLQC